MYALTIKHLLANKVRFALTTLGVTLAVSFVVSAFVLGDGLRNSFIGVSEDVTAGIDLELRATSAFGDRPKLALADVAAVDSVSGVADAQPNIAAPDNAVRPLRPDGRTIPVTGPPLLAFNWIDNPQLNPFTIVTGSPPQVGEFTIDRDSAATFGFVVGDRYEVIVPSGRTHLRLSGTTSFGADNSTLGAVLMQVHTDQAPELFGAEGIDSVVVEVEPGADVAAVAEAIRRQHPDAEVVDHATVLDETAADFTREIDVVRNILLGFGGVALLVSIFFIANTFGIVMSQRSRELALLRAVGAGPRQLRTSVLMEALCIGVLASLAGIAGGVGVAKGIEALFALMGVDLVDYPLIIATRTVLAAVTVGIGVTLIAAAGPARRAAKVAPVTLLRSGAVASRAISRQRALVGAALTVTGVVAGAVGLAGVGTAPVVIACVATGATSLFLAAAALSPLAVGFVTRTLALPMRVLGGVGGRLAQRNATRDPRRTATTAAALMIGLALVTTALVVGQSVKSTLGAAVGRTLRADYVISDGLDDVQFPPSVVQGLRASRTVTAVTGVSYVDARIGGSVTDLGGIDFDQVDAVLDLDVHRGGFTAAAPNPIAISLGAADRLGVTVGGSVPVELPSGVTIDATVAALFDATTIVGTDYLVDDDVLARVGAGGGADWIAIATDSPPAAVDALLDDIVEQQPYAVVETAEQFRHRMESTVDGMLTMISALVTLAVVIALIGIANTLALSTFERTRELGLLRAVGMSRRQLRRMVRCEAALVATFGAIAGVALGLLFGVGIATALPDGFAAQIAVPIVPLAAVVVVAAVAGVVAAAPPARRAGRLDVLDAIAQ